MALVDELKRRFRHVFAPLLGTLLVGYFAYHTVEGDHGIRAWQRLTQDIAEAEVRRDKLRTAETRLERRVSMLRPDSLDRDLLEERARLVLGYVPTDAAVIGSAVLPAATLAGLGVVR